MDKKTKPVQTIGLAFLWKNKINNVTVADRLLVARSCANDITRIYVYVISAIVCEW